ncbi:MAG: ABC transporter permease [Eubacteriales bacterium]|nr:ABC transporter permease [Eubacteriales bacterium]
MKLTDIIKKDVLIVLRDFKALVFIFLMPIVLIVILGLALGGIFASDGFSIGRIDIAVVDGVTESEIAAANAQLGATASYDDMSLYSVLDSDDIGAFISYEVMDADEAESRLESGEIDAVAAIPEGYALDIAGAMTGGGNGTQIDVMGRQGEFETTVVDSVVQAYADTLSSVSADMAVLHQAMEHNVSGQQGPGSDFAAFIQTSVNASLADTVEIDSKGVEARGVLTSFFYYSIAITCMFILYSAGQGSSFLYTESDEKTLERLTVAGVSKKKLLLGKSFAVFSLCILQLIVLFAFSTVAFGINWGNTLVFVAISICVAISVTGLGVLLMVLVYRSGNPRIGNMFQAVLVQIFALFGGSYIPLSVLPKFFSTVSVFTPNGLAVQAYTANVTGAPFSEVLPYIAGSVGLGVALYFIGVMLYPRERKA